MRISCRRGLCFSWLPLINIRGGENRNTPQVEAQAHFLILLYRLVEFRLKLVLIGSPELLKSFGMSSSLVLLCNSRSFVKDLIYSY